MTKLNKSICDESLFDSFFKKHAKFLKDYLYYKFGNKEQAADVVQEAFIKLWNNCNKVPIEKAKSYVYTVATNLSISIKRHEKVKLRYSQQVIKSEQATTNESPEFIILEKEYLHKLTQSIASLPDRQREVFLLSRVEKKKYKEIAELSGVSVKAIEKLMHKALVKLRKELGNI